MGDDVVPLLLKALLSRDPNTSAKASHILANLGRSDPKVIAALVRVMRTKEAGWHRLYRGCWQKMPGCVRALLPRPEVPNTNPMAYSIALPSRFRPLNSSQTPGPARNRRSAPAARAPAFSSDSTQGSVPSAPMSWPQEPVAMTYATTGVTTSPRISRGMGYGHIPQVSAPAPSDPWQFRGCSAAAALAQLVVKARAAQAPGRGGCRWLLPTLIELLDDREDAVCLRATRMLLVSGPEARTATAPLAKLFLDSRRTAALRAEAALVLGHVSRGEALAVKALVQGLHDAAFEVRIHAICALALI